MTTQATTRIAVVGAGHLGRFHARLAAQNEAFELVAVCDPSTTAREALAEEVGARPVADYRLVMNDIDAAVVATPTVTHRQIAGDLLAAGIHCLVEKPLAPTAADAAALVDLADQRGLVLQVGHVERFNPALAQAGELIRNPKFITATRTSGYTFRSTDIGAVLDIMIHDIDLVLGMVDAPVTGVSATGVSVLGGHEDMATATLTFATGCVAQLTASRVSYEMQRTMQVFTERGFAAIDFAACRATLVRPTDAVLNRQFAADQLTPAERDSLRTGLFEQLLVKSESEAPAVNAIELEQKEFALAIAVGAPPTVSGAVGYRAVEVAERVLGAIDRHAWDGDATGRVGPLAAVQQSVQADSPFRRAG